MRAERGAVRCWCCLGAGRRWAALGGSAIAVWSSAALPCPALPCPALPTSCLQSRCTSLQRLRLHIKYGVTWVKTLDIGPRTHVSSPDVATTCPLLRTSCLDLARGPQVLHFLCSSRRGLAWPGSFLNFAWWRASQPITMIIHDQGRQGRQAPPPLSTPGRL